jgi:hypothetical protein
MTTCRASAADSQSAEPLIVMADSSTTSNVEKPLVESVVESSTTGVDANTPTLQPTASGDSASIDKSLDKSNSNNTDTPNTTETLNKDTETGDSGESDGIVRLLYPLLLFSPHMSL